MVWNTWNHFKLMYFLPFCARHLFLPTVASVAALFPKNTYGKRKPESWSKAPLVPWNCVSWLTPASLQLRTAAWRQDRRGKFLKLVLLVKFCLIKYNCASLPASAPWLTCRERSVCFQLLCKHLDRNCKMATQSRGMEKTPLAEAAGFGVLRGEITGPPSPTGLNY